MQFLKSLFPCASSGIVAPHGTNRIDTKFHHPTNPELMLITFRRDQWKYLEDTIEGIKREKAMEEEARRNHWTRKLGAKMGMDIAISNFLLVSTHIGCKVDSLFKIA